MKNRKGITLVTLVIAVVVLLILTGVSLNLIFGRNGILSKSNDVANKYSKQSENERTELNDINLWIDESTEKPIKVNVNEKAKINGTINGEKASNNNPVIPKGYTPIDAGNAIWGDGISSPAQNSVDNGLVIKDDDGNEWVWVPVDEETIKKMYVVSDKENGEKLAGETEITTKFYSNTTTIGKEGDTVKIDRVKPNESEYREPDLVTKYDLEEEYYKNILDFKSPKDMAEAFTKEYENMLKSIAKYGGFYIGRYELSNEGVQKGKTVLFNTNWYNLYKECATLNASEKVETRMIWGVQWDLTCDFISKKGEKKSITDSRSWGNFLDSIDNAAVMDGTTKKYGEGQTTGFSEYWKANNIYDFAGNYVEWTQEAGSNNECRSLMGRDYKTEGASSCTSRIRHYPNEDHHNRIRHKTNFDNTGLIKNYMIEF
ncbi:MAG: hypothetical protein ACLTXD_01145 [Clostridia bacterium]